MLILRSWGGRVENEGNDKGGEITVEIRGMARAGVTAELIYSIYRSCTGNERLFQTYVVALLLIYMNRYRLHIPVLSFLAKQQSRQKRGYHQKHIPHMHPASQSHPQAN